MVLVHLDHLLGIDAQLLREIVEVVVLFHLHGVEAFVIERRVDPAALVHRAGRAGVFLQQVRPDPAFGKLVLVVGAGHAGPFLAVGVDLAVASVAHEGPVLQRGAFGTQRRVADDRAVVRGHDQRLAVVGGAGGHHGLGLGIGRRGGVHHLAGVGLDRLGRDMGDIVDARGRDQRRLDVAHAQVHLQPGLGVGAAALDLLGLQVDARARVDRRLAEVAVKELPDRAFDVLRLVERERRAQPLAVAARRVAERLVAIFDRRFHRHRLQRHSGAARRRVEFRDDPAARRSRRVVAALGQREGHADLGGALREIQPVLELRVDRQAVELEALVRLFLRGNAGAAFHRIGDAAVLLVGRQLDPARDARGAVDPALARDLEQLQVALQLAREPVAGAQRLLIGRHVALEELHVVVRHARDLAAQLAVGAVQQRVRQRVVVAAVDIVLDLVERLGHRAGRAQRHVDRVVDGVGHRDLLHRLGGADGVVLAVEGHFDRVEGLAADLALQVQVDCALVAAGGRAARDRAALALALAQRVRPDLARDRGKRLLVVAYDVLGVRPLALLGDGRFRAELPFGAKLSKPHVCLRLGLRRQAEGRGIAVAVERIDAVARVQPRLDALAGFGEARGGRVLGGLTRGRLGTGKAAGRIVRLRRVLRLRRGLRRLVGLRGRGKRLRRRLDDVRDGIGRGAADTVKVHGRVPGRSRAYGGCRLSDPLTGPERITVPRHHITTMQRFLVRCLGYDLSAHRGGLTLTEAASCAPNRRHCPGLETTRLPD